MRFLRLAATGLLLSSLATPALANTVSENALEDIYRKGFIPGRPVYTQFYDERPSAYFPGLPYMKESNYDHSNCKPIWPDHLEELDLDPPPGMEPAKFDCSKPKRSLTPRQLGLYRYLPLYQLLRGRNLQVLTADGKVQTVQVLPLNYAGQHPYDLRSEPVTTFYAPHRSTQSYLRGYQP